jgi:signal peptidase II
VVQFGDEATGGILLKKLMQGYLFLGSISGLIVVLDQITKWIIRQNLALGETWMPWTWLEPYARIVHWHNRGVAFGMFQEGGDIFAVLAFLVAIAIIYYFPRVPSEDWTLRLAMGLQLGGAVGNLIDRIMIGHVIDFISVGTFPVFNVADSSITVGVFVLIYGVWQQERRERRKKNLDQSTEGDKRPAEFSEANE